MATPNYAFQKRQKELAKRQKQEEKRLRKAAEKAEGEPGDPAAVADDAPAEGETAEPR